MCRAPGTIPVATSSSSRISTSSAFGPTSDQATAVEVVSLNATDEVRTMYEHFGFEESTFPEMRLRIERPVDSDEDDLPDEG